jgi:protoheme IX farnesyltransferase
MATRSDETSVSAKRYFRLALTTAIATWLLIAVGSFVRITGSGLGCPDWPTCHGQIIPPLDPAALIEYVHRLLALLGSILMVLTALAAARWHRSDPWIARPALVVPPLLVVQILLGAFTVLLELPRELVFIHFATASTLLALLVATTVAACTAARRRAHGLPRPRDPLLRAISVTVVATFGMILLGAYVVGAGASLACPAFPACYEHVILPAGNPGAHAHMAHRAGAFVLAALMGVTLWLALRHPTATHGVRRLAVAASVVLVAQILVGIGNVLFLLPGWLRLLHVALATGLWALLVALWVLARHTLGSHEIASTREAPPAERQPSKLRAYLLLTKPGVLVLLLLTTLAAMPIAARGMPPLWLVLLTLVGGGLAAGGAAAFNHYLDRHVDALMARTARRPIAAGLLTPAEGLRFAILASVAGLAVLAIGVNWLAAALALLGQLHYVVIYSRLLKRFTPNNIVLGGAAGAIAPLVGYAAVTNQLDLTAWYLFAIVFFWTPPHFWALALIVRGDYQRAQIPMLPVVYGEMETKRFIVLYSIQLVAVTLLLVPVRAMGWLYFALALLLGAVFVAYAIALYRDDTKRGARRLFRYSILYLALLFVVMVLDRTTWSL